MTLPRLDYSTRIADQLNELASMAKSRSRAGLTDANRIIETVVARLLNTLFGWNLVSLNADDPNNPVVDLSDRGRRLSVQVTVESRPEKIRKTAEGAIKHQLSKDFDKLIVFFLLSKKPGFPKDFKQPSEGPQIETWDIADLLMKLEGTTTPDVLREASKVLDEEMGRATGTNNASARRLRPYVLPSLVVLLMAACATWIGRGAPVAISYVDQYESDAGYVVHLRIRSTNGGTVYVPVESFTVKVKHDDARLQQMAPEKRAQLAYGESATVFTSRTVLNAAIAGRSYANTGGQVACGPQATDLFLLVTVRGPGSANPSARFQLGAVYVGLVVGLKTVWWVKEYLDVPIRHVPIIAGDEKTRVIER